MNKYNVYFLFLLISLFGVVSCDNQEELDDKEAPVISDFWMDRDLVTLGDTILMKYRFTDNVQLSAYKIDLKAKFELTEEDTTHVAYEGTIASRGFRYDEILEASKSDSIKIPIQGLKDKKTLPIATGEYEVIVSCIDRVGNSSSISTNLYLSIKNK